MWKHHEAGEAEYWAPGGTMQSAAEKGGGQRAESQPTVQWWQSTESDAPFQGRGGKRQEHSFSLQVHTEEGRARTGWGSLSAQPPTICAEGADEVSIVGHRHTACRETDTSTDLL